MCDLHQISDPGFLRYFSRIVSAIRYASAPTGPVGMAAAAFAAPMGLRDALIEAYGNSAALAVPAQAEPAPQLGRVINHKGLSLKPEGKHPDEGI